MKKILTIFTVIIYLAVTCGLVMEVHYCMGREIGSTIKFAGNETHKCGKCGMENANNKCCHDDIKFLKLQSDQQQAFFDFQSQSPAAPVQEFDLIHPWLIISGDESSISNHSPPDDTSPSLCILHCVFRL